MFCQHKRDVVDGNRNTLHYQNNRLGRAAHLQRPVETARRRTFGAGMITRWPTAANFLVVSLISGAPQKHRRGQMANDLAPRKFARPGASNQADATSQARLPRRLQAMEEKEKRVCVSQCGQEAATSTVRVARDPANRQKEPGLKGVWGDHHG